MYDSIPGYYAEMKAEQKLGARKDKEP